MQHFIILIHSQSSIKQVIYVYLPVKEVHLAVVPLVVVLVVPPGVLPIGDVMANPSAVADDKAMAGGKAVAVVELIGGVDIPKQ